MNPTVTNPQEVTTVASATTEPTKPMSRRQRRPADWSTIGFATAAIFLAVFTLLVTRMNAGLDPAIASAKARQTAQTLQRRLLIDRRVIHETIIPADPATQTGTGYVASAAPSTSYSTPAPTYYAPAPAPVTRAS